MRTLKNFDAGNIWAGAILALLLDHWPAAIDIDARELIKSTGVTCEADEPELVIMDLLYWLENENFIRSNQKSEAQFYNVHLTEKSLAILSAVPANLAEKKTYGQLLKENVADIGKEAAKSQLGEIFGQIIGSATRSLIS